MLTRLEQRESLGHESGSRVSEIKQETRLVTGNIDFTHSCIPLMPTALQNVCGNTGKVDILSDQYSLVSHPYQQHFCYYFNDPSINDVTAW